MDLADAPEHDRALWWRKRSTAKVEKTEVMPNVQPKQVAT